MMDSLKIWWNGREPRERVLLGIMIVLLTGVVGWLGIYNPLQKQLRAMAYSNLDAADRYGDVARKVDWLKMAGKDGGKSPSVPVEQIVGQSAGEAGFTLDQVEVEGKDRVKIVIASARSTALLGWIAQLEAQGVAVDLATITPSGASGTVSAQISFRRAGGGA